MRLSRWDEGSDSDHVTGLNRDKWLVGHCKIFAWQWAKLPRYWREGAVEVRPFPAEKRLCVSEAQGLSGEAMRGNPTTTVIPGVDESKSGPRATKDLTEPKRLKYQEGGHCKVGSSHRITMINCLTEHWRVLRSLGRRGSGSSFPSHQYR